MSAAIAALAVVSVPLPFTPIPISLATFAVMLTGALLGPLDGVISTTVYLLLGAAGVPIFAGMKGGAGVLFGPTGGFLVGYIALAFGCGILPKVLGKKRGSFAAQLVSMLLSNIALYTFGCSWFVFSAGVGLQAAVGACVLPFLPGDVLKMVAAALLSARFAKVVSDFGTARN